MRNLSVGGKRDTEQSFVPFIDQPPYFLFINEMRKGQSLIPDIAFQLLPERGLDRIASKVINRAYHAHGLELRCRMLHNRFAGEALEKVDLL